MAKRRKGEEAFVIPSVACPAEGWIEGRCLDCARHDDLRGSAPRRGAPGCLERAPVGYHPGRDKFAATNNAQRCVLFNVIDNGNAFLHHMAEGTSPIIMIRAGLNGRRCSDHSCMHVHGRRPRNQQEGIEKEYCYGFSERQDAKIVTSYGVTGNSISSDPRRSFCARPHFASGTSPPHRQSPIQIHSGR